MSDTEQDRQRLLEELTEENGPDWEEQHKPGSFGCHELLDRTALLADQLERLLMEHPACVRNPEWFALAKQAASTLEELYQRIGAEHLAESDEP